MTQTLPKSIIEARVTFEEFTNLDTVDKKYELHDGVIVEMAQPVGCEFLIVEKKTLSRITWIKR